MSRSPTAWNCRSSAARWCRCCRRAPSSKARPRAPRWRRPATAGPRGIPMNRYPLWKYATLLVALLIGVLYTLPNFYGEAPAVQVSSAKATLKLDAGFVSRVQQLLDSEGLQPDLVQFDGNSVRARLPDTDAQMKARDALDKALNPDPSDPRYIVALNLVSRSPTWLTSIHALPMYLGLDLRGGVHFLMQVDMKAALTKKAESVTGRSEER